MSSNPAAFRRRNPLTGEWVLVSPHRNNRPWSGATEEPSKVELPAYESNCPLCPGNARANDTSNPNYESTFVFKNDFAALTEHEIEPVDASDLFQEQSAVGEARVICFSPEHNKTLPQLTEQELLSVVNTWQREYSELSEIYNCVQIFENKGEVMGCSQPHPHGQIWAHQHLATEVEKEELSQKAYFDDHSSALLSDYVAAETKDASRTVCENDHWLVVVPFWAKWPFETLLVSKDGIADFIALNQAQKLALASILKELTTRYDNVFNTSFPYSMGWHNAPSTLEDKSHWVLHAHFYPPLLRSATIKKHMVGYEMLGESQRDLTPELAAKILREVSSTHYLEN
ncbi:UDP-glucose--hexose-1-phosphate uridylyltransferase [Agaribacter marinus]|uniref:Galactose-1-phosphate uridylyltransferase n=1 Tax=Agaribacter marinus TaxID=1431249 RepID=A0AA37SXN4_9ALTE|nr:UDP-glucose--hexose-1-phosphate uridylyltransferase [Agaribacter marinus]GLR71721.1 galactose-1-phosphate uridylyltransferase [Agaribacter marinus]